MSVALAAGAHWSASGVLPGVLPVLACLLGLAWAARRMTWREWSGSEIVMLLVAAGGICHVVFALAGSLGSGGDVVRALLLGAHAGGVPDGSQTLMLAVHLLASGLAALALRRGEAALWRLARAAAVVGAKIARLIGPRVKPSQGASPQAIAASAGVSLVRHRRVVCAAARRGPPRRAARALI